MKKKRASNVKPKKCLCQITDVEWAYFSEHPDEWDIIKGRFKDLRNTKEYKRKQKEKLEEEFNREFFITSLGYIRRKVHMADGSTKDFLSDLLQGIQSAVLAGQEVSVIAYNKPDFDNILPIESYQHVEVATPQFLQECLVQLGKDFKPSV